MSWESHLCRNPLIFWLWAPLLLCKCTVQSTSSLQPLHLIIWLSFGCPVIVTNITLYWLWKRTFLTNENSIFCSNSSYSSFPAPTCCYQQGISLRTLWCLCTVQIVPCSVMNYFSTHMVRSVARQPNAPAEASQVWMLGCKAGWLSSPPWKRGPEPVLLLSPSNSSASAVNCATQGVIINSLSLGLAGSRTKIWFL